MRKCVCDPKKGIYNHGPQGCEGDQPVSGKVYALTAFKSGGPSIANGNTWAESEVRETTPEQHADRIARDTLRMPDEMVGVMGGPSKAEARARLKERK